MWFILDVFDFDFDIELVRYVMSVYCEGCLLFISFDLVLIFELWVYIDVVWYFDFYISEDFVDDIVSVYVGIR